jgi:hypothetical protein
MSLEVRHDLVKRMVPIQQGEEQDLQIVQIVEEDPALMAIMERKGQT